MKNILKKIIVSILTLEARAVLFKYKPKIIVITGSVGKTGTKDAIFDVVNTTFFTRKSQKSYNSELGVPLTILGLSTGWESPLAWIKNIFEGLALIFLKNHYPKWLVLEVGTDRPGDIKSLTKWLRPDIVVVTRIGEVPVHVEFFDSPAEVLKEKAYLVKALKEDGFLVLNSDDEKVRALDRKTRAEVTTYGLSREAKLRGTHTQVIYDENSAPTGVTFKVEFGQNVIPVVLNGTVGVHHTYNALAALAVGAHLGINMISMTEALEHYESPKGRMRIIEGLRGSTIIDDSYNSSPVAAEAALKTIADISTTGKHIAVLGDMLELGKYATQEHRRIGKIAGETCDMLIAVGPRAQYFAEGALLGGLSEKMIIQFDDSRDAGKYLESIISKGDVILIKGSQSMRMERAVQEIMAHPERRKELLVRQEGAWESR